MATEEMVKGFITETEVNEAKEKFIADVKERFSENLKDDDFLPLFKEGNIEYVKATIKKIESNVIASIPLDIEGISIPSGAVFISCSVEEGVDTIHLVNISFSSTALSKRKFKYSVTVNADEYAMSAIQEFFATAYLVEMEYLLADNNINGINKVLEEAVQVAGLDYSITLEINNGSSQVVSISDDAIVFKVDKEKIFGINVGDSSEITDALEYRIMELATRPITEDSDEEAIQVHEEAIGLIAESLSLSQTPAQLVANRGGAYIQYFCSIKKTGKAFSILKKVVNRNAKNFGRAKVDLGYYETEDAYAIVKKDGDDLSIVLSPINKETLRSVELDVIGALS